MIILITGITSGFGRAMAERLNADGHTVYGTHRRDCPQLLGVHYIKADVASEQDCRAAVQQVLDEQGRIDVFINNAGMGIGGPLEFCTLEQAQKQMDTNWMGMVRCLHWVLPAMRKQGSGKIICFSSIGGLMGLPFQGLYSASKFAIEGYCEALRLEVKKLGIKVIVIEPGDFATSFTASRNSVICGAIFEMAICYRWLERGVLCRLDKGGKLRRKGAVGRPLRDRPRGSREDRAEQRKARCQGDRSV